MKKFTLIKAFIVTGNVGVPGTAILLAFLSPHSPYGWFFTSFIILHAIERVWETFYTSHERHPHEFHGDWPLALATTSYILMCFLVILEFFLLKRIVNLSITLLGFLLYAIAFRLRWWGIKSLGSQWSIHAVGAIKLKKYRLLRIGAYKYVRHPVYLGTIIEEISLPLVANAFLTLFFVLIVCVPLMVIRAIFEEKSSLRKFGTQYEEYREEVGMFLPTQFFWNRSLQCH